MTDQVRVAVPADADAIIAVARQTWAATYQGIIPEDIQQQALAEWYAPERVVRSITNGLFLVATAGDGQVIGFANASHRQEAGDAELWRFYVLPEHQGLGVGRRLLQATLTALRATRPVERLYVQVEAENQIGRRAYEGLGFGYVREYDDEVLGHVSRMCEMCLSNRPG